MMKTFLFLKFSTIIQFFEISPFISIPLFFLILPSILIYFIFLVINIIGLLKLSDKSKLSINQSVSIIVAIRNGEKSLLRLIQSLADQDYKGKLEFILVDDQSTDNTKDIIQKIQARDSRFKYVSSNEVDCKLLKFKKRALHAGIKKSQNEIFKNLVKSSIFFTLDYFCSF